MIQQGNEIDMKDAQLTAMLAQSKLFPESAYAASGAKLTLVGNEKVEGKDCYKIDVALGEIKWTDYYEVATGFKIRQIISQGQITITSTFSDFKEVGGVKFPHKMNQDMGQIAFDLTVSKVEVNKNLPDAIFEIK